MLTQLTHAGNAFDAHQAADIGIGHAMAKTDVHGGFKSIRNMMTQA
jgi:hypothetical protein